MHRLYSTLGISFLMMIASSKAYCQTRVLDDFWMDELREGLDWYAWVADATSLRLEIRERENEWILKYPILLDIRKKALDEFELSLRRNRIPLAVPFMSDAERWWNPKKPQEKIESIILAEFRTFTNFKGVECLEFKLVMCSTNASRNIRTGLYNDVHVELPIYQNSIEVPLRNGVDGKILKGVEGKSVFSRPADGDINKFLADISRRTDRFCLGFLREQQAKNIEKIPNAIDDMLRRKGVVQNASSSTDGLQ